MISPQIQNKNMHSHSIFVFFSTHTFYQEISSCQIFLFNLAFHKANPFKLLGNGFNVYFPLHGKITVQLKTLLIPNLA
jgi:hypothetical protein